MSAAVAPLQDAFWRVCERLMYRHTTPWELDEALVAWGYGLGPCEAQDLIGLDVVLRVRDGVDVTPVLPRMVAEGRIGKRFGWGYYRYPGGGGAVIDPLIEDLICEEAWLAKVSRTELAGDVLVTRLHEEMREELRGNIDAAVRLLHFPADRLAVI
ncbi:3-hydroxyacyl-CoA dehydrogenase family protein [uncultured Tateyamaria sp.]|uniref:3-hydroxyacyl-CoA dehydrogenase family protein n=1 Tax=uncultured Tateyamaria sp. TaxID=455651 RepID=UPI002627C3EC|nr:3-hydroxyacyl-CoA dehydrogenase family protein [uncultured Tateyamaria sp.]